MLQKLKDWFSIENNVALVRDCLFIGTLILALFAGMSSCMPIARAAEVETTESEDYVESSVSAPNILNRYRMSPYIQVGEDGEPVYDGKYFTGTLLEDFVLVKKTSGDLYLYTYTQHGDDFLVDYESPNVKLSCCGGVLYDAGSSVLRRGYVSGETLYVCPVATGIWEIADPITAYNTFEGAIVDMTDASIIGSTDSIATLAGDGVYYVAGISTPVFDPVGYTTDISKGLFDVAGECIKFILDHPIVLVSCLLFIFVAGAGIVKNFITGV